MKVNYINIYRWGTYFILIIKIKKSVLANASLAGNKDIDIWHPTSVKG